jgi:hypothetical protein
MGLETLALASLIVAGAGTAYSVYSNEKAKDDADRAAKEQLAANTKAAESEADRIQFNADKLKKAQRASAAKAGLVTNVGTALDVQKETDVLSARDIKSVMETKDARNQGVLSEAKMFTNRMNANSANSVLGLANTALGAADTMKKNNNFIKGQEAKTASSAYDNIYFGRA